MKSPLSSWILVCSLAAVAVNEASRARTNVAASPPAFAACFAPGTPPEVVAAHARTAAASPARSSLAPPPNLLGAPEFNITNRWSSTATDGSGLGQGEPTTLTWSVVPDGTFIDGFNGEPAAGSNLRAFLDSIYPGGEAEWRPLFQQVFDRWSELTGTSYVFEPNDDGADLVFLPGQIGVRGDVRIGGHLIDGNSNVLAYNFFPDSGDMVIDTADSFYTDTLNDSLKLRNVLAHEHGHGLGLSHVCPVNQTKLMEPFVSTAFDGPQHDDFLAVNRSYGDADEQNDAPGTATSLGAVITSELFDRSIDDAADADVFSFTADPSSSLAATATPTGTTYLSGPQNGDGTCTAGTSFDSLRQNDLGLEILDTDGAGTLAMSTGNPAGSPESVNAVSLASGGTYFVRVIPGFETAAQMYDLFLNVTSSACTSGSPDLTAQSVSTTQEFVGCTISSGDGFEVAAGGDVTFRARTTITLRDGFSVLAGGSFSAVIDAGVP